MMAFAYRSIVIYSMGNSDVHREYNLQKSEPFSHCVNFQPLSVQTALKAAL